TSFPRAFAPGREQVARGKIRGRAGCRVRQKRVTALCTNEQSAEAYSTASKTGEPASRARLVFGFPSPDPRRTSQPILRWRTFPASPYARWHAVQTQPPRKALVTSGRLAGTKRLQPPPIRACVSASCGQPLPAPRL